MSGNISSIKYTEYTESYNPAVKDTGKQNVSSIQLFQSTLAKPNTESTEQTQTAQNKTVVQKRNLNISELADKYKDNPLGVLNELGINFTEKQIKELEKAIKDEKHLKAFLTIVDKANLKAEDIMAAVKKSKEFKNSNIFKRGWNVLKTVFTDGISEAVELAKSERVYYTEKLSENMSVIRNEREDFSSEGLANISDICIQEPDIADDTLHFVTTKSEPGKHVYTESDVISAAEFMQDKPQEAETFVANAQELESIKDTNGKMKYQGSTIINVDKRMVNNKDLQPTMMKTAHKADMTDEYLNNITYNLEKNPYMQDAIEYSLNAKKSDGTDRFSANSINSESNHLLDKTSNYCANYTNNLKEIAPYENISSESIVKVAGNITSHPETKNDVIRQIKNKNLSESEIVAYSDNLTKNSEKNNNQASQYNVNKSTTTTSNTTNTVSNSTENTVTEPQNNNYENIIKNNSTIKNTTANPIEKGENNKLKTINFSYLENLQNSYISESDYNRIYNYFGSMTDNLIAKIKKDPSFVEVIKACNGNKVIIEAELNNPGLVAKIRSAANPTNKQLSEILSVCTDNSSTNVMLAALEACSVNQAIKATRYSKITNTKQDALSILGSTKSNTNKQSELEQLYGVGTNREFVC